MIGKTVGSIRSTVDAVPGGNWAMAWLIGVDLERRRDHVGAPFEGSRNLHSTAARRGAHVCQLGDAEKRLLYRCRDLQHHLLGGTVAGIERDPDARELDVG